MKKTTAILTTILLAGCVTSPAVQMTSQEVSQLSNRQLCELRNNYPWEQNTEIEIGRRNLNCDPAENECLAQGNRPGTPAMALCVKQMRDGWAMQKELQQKDSQLQQQQIRMQNQQNQEKLLQSIENQRYMDNFWNRRQ